MTPIQLARLRKLAAIRRQRAEADLATSLTRQRALADQLAELDRPPETDLPEQGAADVSAFLSAGLRETWRGRKRSELSRTLQQVKGALPDRKQELSVALGQESALAELDADQARAAQKAAQRREDDAPPAHRPRPWD
ncbi:hypothetical protein ACW9UR_11630 [Halovulum sp. GXIMD14794]